MERFLFYMDRLLSLIICDAQTILKIQSIGEYNVTESKAKHFWWIYKQKETYHHEKRSNYFSCDLSHIFSCGVFVWLEHRAVITGAERNPDTRTNLTRKQRNRKRDVCQGRTNRRSPFGKSGNRELVRKSRARSKQRNRIEWWPWSGFYIWLFGGYQGGYWLCGIKFNFSRKRAGECWDGYSEVQSASWGSSKSRRNECII